MAIQLSGSLAITGSLVATSQIVAQTLNVQQVTSSIVYSSGSNIFGNSVSNTQQFTGSLQVSGSTSYILGNVGIGTTSPATKLDVIGNIRNSNAGQTVYTEIQNDGLYATGTDLYLLAPASKFMSFYAGGSERMRINQYGQLLINATSSAYSANLFGYNLGVRGTNNQTFISIARANQTLDTQGMIVGLDTTIAYMFVHDNIPLTLSTNAAERMRITSGGNVGIGTTSPAVPLQIRDSSVSSGGSAIHAYGFDGAANFYTSRGEDPYNAALYLYNNPSAGQGYGTGIIFRAKSDTTVSQIQGSIYTTWTTATDASRTSKMVFSTVNSGTSSDKVTISGNGSVGIGTTSPATLLNIEGNDADAIQFRIKNNSITNGNKYLAMFVAGTSGYTITGWANSGVIESAGGTNSNFVLGNYEDGPIIFQTNNRSEKVRITSGGNVGIGTTSPGNRLHVTNTGGSLSTLTDIIGRFNATTNTSGSGSAIALTAISTKETGVILGAEHTSGNNGDFVVRIYNGGADYPERMRITSGGGVVIGGTVASNVGLTIYGSNAATIYQTPNTGTGAANGFYVGHTGDVSYVWNYNNYPTVFATNNTERMRITSGGNVGIGTTSPTAPLVLATPGSTVDGTFFSTFTINNTGTSTWSRIRFDRSGVARWGVGMGTDDKFRLTNMYLNNTVTADDNLFVISSDNTITINGNFLPYSNGTLDLGSSSNRWGTVFTSDLDMSNGIGDYTIVEGEEDLFLYNNKTNKVFKFVIQEVDPSEATPKMKR